MGEQVELTGCAAGGGCAGRCERDGMKGCGKERQGTLIQAPLSRRQLAPPVPGDGIPWDGNPPTIKRLPRGGPSRPGNGDGNPCSVLEHYCFTSGLVTEMANAWLSAGGSPYAVAEALYEEMGREYCLRGCFRYEECELADAWVVYSEYEPESGGLDWAWTYNWICCCSEDPGIDPPKFPKLDPWDPSDDCPWEDTNA